MKKVLVIGVLSMVLTGHAMNKSLKKLLLLSFNTSSRVGLLARHTTIKFDDCTREYGCNCMRGVQEIFSRMKDSQYDTALVNFAGVNGDCLMVNGKKHGFVLIAWQDFLTTTSGNSCPYKKY